MNYKIFKIRGVYKIKYRFLWIWWTAKTYHPITGEIVKSYGSYEEAELMIKYDFDYISFNMMRFMNLNEKIISNEN